MHSYPIWNEVSNGQTDKSFGSKNGYSQIIKIGASKKNSKDFAKIEVRFFEDDKGKEFRLFVDNVVVKKMSFDKKSKDFELKYNKFENQEF